MDYTTETKNLLDELVSPIPFLFRSAAKKMIDKKIREVAADKGQTKIDRDTVIRGYLLASQGKDMDRVKSFLISKGIDLSPYQDLIK